MIDNYHQQSRLMSLTSVANREPVRLLDGVSRTYQLSTDEACAAELLVELIKLGELQPLERYIHGFSSKPDKFVKVASVALRKLTNEQIVGEAVRYHDLFVPGIKHAAFLKLKVKKSRKMLVLTTQNGVPAQSFAPDPNSPQLLKMLEGDPPMSLMQRIGMLYRMSDTWPARVASREEGRRHFVGIDYVVMATA